MKTNKPLIPIHPFGSNDINFDITKLDAGAGEHEDQRSYHPQHRHSYYEIFIFFEGGGNHRIDFREFPIEAGSLHFISPGQVHQVRRGAGCHGYVITFTEELYALHEEQKSLLQQVELYHNYSAPAIVSFSPVFFDRIRKLTLQMEQEYHSQGLMKEELMRSYLNIMLIHSNRMFRTAQDGAAVSGRHTIVQRFRQLLDTHFADKQQVQDYARLLGVTSNYLNDTIKSATGITASQHIHNRLLLEAKRLLFNTGFSIKEIAFSLGFQDPTYFGRFFRNLAGTTPGDFREATREKYHK
jgi:AraC family transcriptional activator of pobA